MEKYSTLIKDIENKFGDNDKLKSIFLDYNELISALKELENIVGLEKIKEATISMLKTVIMSKVLKQSLNMYLHTIITGPPGVGKTSVGKILSKIWYYSGAIKAAESKNNSEDCSLSLFDQTCQIKIRETRPNSPVCKNDCVSDSCPNTPLLSSKTEKDDINEICLHLEDIDHFVTGCLMNQSEVPEDERTNIHKENIKYLTKTKDLLKLSDDKIQKLKRSNNIKNILGNFMTSISDAIKPPKKKEHFVIARREDFVGEYLGQTSIKTKKCLESALGGVLFIDEAYTLYNPNYSNGDAYGLEALTLINEYMSEHKDEIIVIMSGYKDLIEKGPFIGQPGLKRRFQWNFDIEDYTGEDLTKIFERQITDLGLKLESEERLIKLFKTRKTELPNNGGDTQRLAQKCKQRLISNSFDAFLGEEDVFKHNFDKTLSYGDIETCFDGMKETKDENRHVMSMFS